MPTFTFYRLDTGEVLPQRYSGPEHSLQANTPPGCGAVPGRFDGRARRVVDGEVQEWQPPKPQGTARWGHEWDEQQKCWGRVPSLLSLKTQVDRSILRAIADEEKPQARMVREALLLLTDSKNAAAVAARLRSIETRIESARVDLSSTNTANRGQLIGLLNKYSNKRP